MKLYKIIIKHYAPKDMESAIKEYVVANNDKEVFEYLSEGYACWSDLLLNSEEDKYWEILKNKGDNRDVENAFYGETRYSWEEVTLQMYAVIINLMIQENIAKDIRKINMDLISKYDSLLTEIQNNDTICIFDKNNVMTMEFNYNEGEYINLNNKECYKCYIKEYSSDAVTLYLDECDSWCISQDTGALHIYSK